MSADQSLSHIFLSKHHMLEGYFLSDMGVSKNNGTPKSPILIEFSIVNHPFWDTPIFGNTHIDIKTKKSNGRDGRWDVFFCYGRNSKQKNISIHSQCVHKDHDLLTRLYCHILYIQSFNHAHDA